MNDERKKISGTYLVLLPILLSLFLIGVSVIMKVACLGAIGSILILLQYVYYIRTIREKSLLKIRNNEIEGDSINDILKEFVNDNVDAEASWIYRYYKKGEEVGKMLVYEDCYSRENANTKEIMQGYHDIVLKEYDNLNRTEIDFVSRTGGRVYISLRTNIYGKDYVVVFIISAKSSMEQKELDLKVERLKRDFILRRKL